MVLSLETSLALEVPNVSKSVTFKITSTAPIRGAIEDETNATMSVTFLHARSYGGTQTNKQTTTTTTTTTTIEGRGTRGQWV